MLEQLNSLAEDTASINDIELFLQKNSIDYSSKNIHEIQKRGFQIKELKKNPFLLIEFFGFKKIDNANRIEKSQEERNRLVAGILYVLNKVYEISGHTAINRAEFVFNVCKELSLEATKDINNEINTLISKKIIHAIDEAFVTSEKYFLMEKYINDVLRAKAKVSKGSIKNSREIEAFIEEEEAQIGFSYSDQQKDGIRLANKNFSIFSINGYAGSGKTTTALSILNLFSFLYGEERVICCAFSGMAANRARIATGYKSVTIHSLLGYDGEEFSRNEDNKLDYSFIMLDEAGMVSSELFYALLKAIDFSKTTLMIAGDNAQLQSIGNGDIYNNILTLGLCTTVTLDKIYRQKETQVINIIAQSIREGDVPLDFTDSNYDDFKFFQATGRNIIDTITNISKKHIIEQNRYIANGEYDKFLTSFQVIIPIKKGIYGVHNINNVLQQLFNRTESKYIKEIETKDQHTVIKIKDKVIHLKNQKMRVLKRETFEKHGNLLHSLPSSLMGEEKIFNGQMGVVVDMTKKDTFVYYPDNNLIALYSNNDISRYGLLDLAYAITVHKSQGSQYNAVLLPMVSQYSRMLNNKLLYTAITRAKDMLYVIGETTTFANSCKTNDSTKRETILNHL